MDKCIKLNGFMKYLLDDEKSVKQGAEIVRAILEAQSPRITHITEKMGGSSARAYKAIQRFIQKNDLKQALLRLYQEEAEFVIGDPTEMERYHCPKTSYVGQLSDGKTEGYWLMVLSTPFRGRAIPFWFVIYSSRTIGDQNTSRNQEHYRCFEEIKNLLGDRPLVLDREFSYEDLMDRMTLEHVQFVIRLNTGDLHKQTRLSTGDGKPIKLFIRHAQVVIYRNIYYRGHIKVNLIGFWRKGFSKPLWIITSLDPQEALEIYFKRMKIEETFRDCKNLLHLPKLMNKQLSHLEQMIALTLIAYVVGLWLGEALRDVIYARVNIHQLHNSLLNRSFLNIKAHSKWLLYSGLFVLLKQKILFSQNDWDALVLAAANAFASLVFGIVRSFV